MHTTTLTPWVQRAWNPITGCKKGCSYCYLRRRLRGFSGDDRMNLIQRNAYTMNGEMIVLDHKFVGVGGHTYNTPFKMKPTYHRNRLQNLDQVKQGMRIGVCMDGEMFGPWVPDDIIKEIFDACAEHPLNHYLFLTAYPQRYRELKAKGLLPQGDAYWYGSSVVDPEDDIFYAKGYHCFAHYLPLKKLEYFVPSQLEWVIIDDVAPFKDIGITCSIDSAQDIADDCGALCLPAYISDSYGDQVKGYSDRYPEILLEHEFTEKKKKIVYTKCLLCGKEGGKKQMYSLVTYPERGSTVTLGFICQDCWDTWCKQMGISKETEEYVRKRKAEYLRKRPLRGETSDRANRRSPGNREDHGKED